MRREGLALIGLLVLAFGLGARLELWFQGWAGNRAESASVLQVALGDGRKLFANHFFSKADAYFHNGYYPTIYDDAGQFEQGHLSSEVRHPGEDRDDGEGENFLGQPKDWIDRFGRHFYPSRHTHLGESSRVSSGVGPIHDQGPGGARDDHTPARADDIREILPWLRLSAQLDPERVETYVVASYWLRTKLGRVDEAEQFLREGLQANPGDCEMLFELGRISYENRRDAVRARTLWELALKNWRARQAGKPDPDKTFYISLLNQLALLEREQRNYPRAIEYYTLLLEVTPSPASIRAWIDYLKTNGPPLKVGLSSP